MRLWYKYMYGTSTNTSHASNEIKIINQDTKNKKMSNCSNNTSKNAKDTRNESKDTDNYTINSFNGNFNEYDLLKEETLQRTETQDMTESQLLEMLASSQHSIEGSLHSIESSLHSIASSLAELNQDTISNQKVIRNKSEFRHPSDIHLEFNNSAY